MGEGDAGCMRLTCHRKLIEGKMEMRKAVLVRVRVYGRDTCIGNEPHVFLMKSMPVLLLARGMCYNTCTD